ncbi:YfhJ family protein [Bacillus licheniformis]|nr:YfhJ family protein [Bacillus licheniformis]
MGRFRGDICKGRPPVQRKELTERVVKEWIEHYGSQLHLFQMTSLLTRICSPEPAGCFIKHCFRRK